MLGLHLVLVTLPKFFKISIEKDTIIISIWVVA